MKRHHVVIIGASSGIGKALAHYYHKQKHELILCSRRMELLEQVEHELDGKPTIQRMDVTNLSEAITVLQNIFDTYQPISHIILNAGVGFINSSLDWDKEELTINTNVLGFAQLAIFSFNFFQQQGFGHLIGISSAAEVRGNGRAPAYNASKAFVSNYLDSLRQKATVKKIPISITDIRPGFVLTPMTEHQNNMPGLISAEKAARLIYNAIQKKKSVAYIPWFWRIIAYIMHRAPNWLYDRF